jgi:hypothetical protein
MPGKYNLKNTLMTKKIYTIFTAVALLTGIGRSNAQLTVVDSLTAQQLVMGYLAGNGIVFSNITYTGDSSAIGAFLAQNSNLGITSGILLTSGNVNNAVGPNTQSGASANNAAPGDPDLDSIIQPAYSFDAAVLEFDFTTPDDSVMLRYVFASEEYMEYVSQTPGGINDGFGFFLSGPGISGPYQNGAINLAILPNTTIPVTIFNVNCSSPNSAFYVCNEPNNTLCMPSFNCPSQTTVEYDGFTVVLTAKAAVVPFQTYHIKIAIGDGGDGILDSGVFLEAGSFTSIVPNAVAGLNKPSSGNLLVYPQPAHERLTIDGKNLQEATRFTITDALGKTCYRSEMLFPGQQQELELNRFQAGMYFITWTTATGMRQGKLVIN